MKIGTTKFITENIAPSNASKLVVFNGDTKICEVDISKMKPTNLGLKLYSFGLLGDMHMGSNGHDVYLNDALNLFKSEKCNFCTHVGDMTNEGFYLSETSDISHTQFALYKSVIDKYKETFLVYGICGNHESYYERSIMENLDKLVYYTGTPLYYTLSSNADDKPTENGGNIYNPHIAETDVFVFIGQPSGTPKAINGAYEYVWVEELDWLEATLEANKNKRCFVYEHLTLTDDAGNPNNIHNAFWGDLEERLLTILRSYNNTILFHGHSHLDLAEQFNFPYANYKNNGFKSVHVGAPCGGRVTENGVLQKDEGVNGCGSPARRCGYIVDVYANHIVLKGYYFATSELIPIAQYCIDTTN